MNFEITLIEKVSDFIKDKWCDYIVHIDMPDLDEPLPVICTAHELLNFKEVQLKVLRKHDRVIIISDMTKWGLYLDDAMRYVLVGRS